MEALLVIVCWVTLLVVGGTMLRRNQRRIWNKGYCGCGGMWRYFDMDSGGAHGAKCDRCRGVYWFDWFVGDEIDPIGILK